MPLPFYLLMWSTKMKTSRRNEFESEGGAPVRYKAQENFVFLVVPLHFFGSKSANSRFGEHFRDGQYSLVSFLFAVLLLTVPPPSCPAICKSGSTCPPCPMESAPLSIAIRRTCRFSQRWPKPSPCSTH